MTMFFNLKKSGEGRRVAGPILVIRTSANGVKNLPRRHSKKKPIASRIRREDTARRNQWRQESAEKKSARRNPAQSGYWGNSVWNLRGSASVVSKIAVDVGCDTLPHDMCGKESIFFKTFTDHNNSKHRQIKVQFVTLN